jgi:hypothetical protein
MNKHPWFRARDALQFIEWYTEMAARQCALAVYVLPGVGHMTQDTCGKSFLLTFLAMK